MFGSLCFLLFGMKLMSDGIQKSTGDKVSSLLSFMTKNRFMGILTGCLLTMIIQSSGATTVMTVSFVNAGLLSLVQAISVIFGANIGTTITAWIVALFGFNFKIQAFAIPIFGIGYILYTLKKLKSQNIGMAIMGFAILFVALDWLSGSISKNVENFTFLINIQQMGILSIPLGFLVGIFFTALIHSSSAMTAIVITMAYNQMLTWEFSAAMIIGSNIGSTIDSIMASFNSTPNAKRTALVHVLFNFTSAIIALIFLRPFTRFVDFIIPGPVTDNITFHIAMLHTCFNILGTLIFTPFINQIAKLTLRIIPENADKIKPVYKLDFVERSAMENPAAAIIIAQNEINKMFGASHQMFSRLNLGFIEGFKSFMAAHFEVLQDEENYIDQMNFCLTKYIAGCEKLDLTNSQRLQLQKMNIIVEETEALSDAVMDIGIIISKMQSKNFDYSKEQLKFIIPYLQLVDKQLKIISQGLWKNLSQDEFTSIREIENNIDENKRTLKKYARTQLESGADANAQLTYIDLVRKIEKLGDHCFAIANVEV